MGNAMINMNESDHMNAGYVVLIVIGICAFIVFIKMRLPKGLTDDDEANRHRKKRKNELNENNVVLIFNKEKCKKIKKYEYTLSEETSGESEESDSVLQQVSDH